MKLSTIAVTGTNGKTTTTSMVDAIVAASGEPSARVTTLGSWVAGQQLSDGVELDAFTQALDRAREVGVRTLALETTSKALAEGFAQRFPATVAVFTNLSRDHFDYHASAEDYLAAKAQLFMSLRAGGVAVLNACDASSALLSEVLPAGVQRLAYAARARSPECAGWNVELTAARIVVTRSGTAIDLEPSPHARELGGRLLLRVVGEVYAEDALAAALATSAAGYPAAAIRAGLASFAGVPGRFEVVWTKPLIVIDYAHTPDALHRTLAQARALTPAGRLLAVFGCGGERDPGKRPEMGRVAAAAADLTIVTSDNPRGEDPHAIIAAIVSGARRDVPGLGGCIVIEEPDRRTAIERAIAGAQEHDTIVVAGRGHEQRQWIGNGCVPFSDAEVARELAARGRPSS
jgi:UDP-N-acetylmuramoyl-L-alanyl-D-glutamate--2,6-diaminopimelate ligase